jgi:hypothetical protein
MAFCLQICDFKRFAVGGAGLPGRWRGRLALTPFRSMFCLATHRSFDSGFLSLILALGEILRFLVVGVGYSSQALSGCPRGICAFFSRFFGFACSPVPRSQNWIFELISKKPSGENFSPWQGVGGLRERVWERGNPFPESETAESLKELESLKISQEYLLGFQYV